MQREPGLAESVRRLYAVFNEGDPSLADELVSSESAILGIGTDPREWWQGDAFRQAFRVQVPEMHGAGLVFEPGDPEAHSEGSVGWTADRPTLRTQDGTGIPMRLTAVWRREAGGWRLVQFHLSIGTANEEALGAELTI